MSENKMPLTIDDFESSVYSEIPFLRGITASKDKKEIIGCLRKISKDISTLSDNIGVIKSKTSQEEMGIISEKEIELQIKAWAFKYELQYSFVNLVNTIDYAKEILERITTNNKDLANKYLYLGAQGAYAWTEVEKALRIKQLASYLLKNNINKILRAAIKINNSKSLDIVSLGSGTGGDDVEILDSLQGFANKSRNSFFAVDISADLLRLGIDNVIKHAKANGFYQNVAFNGLCIDIENLPNIKQYILSRANNDNCLFHLLGLTLGNNRELKFLKTISLTMKEGDFLLLGLDFSLDDASQYEKVVNSYLRAKAQILEFLSGPLKIAMQINASSSPIKLEGVWNSTQEYDYLTKHFCLHTEDEDGHLLGRSNIPETRTLARYYVEAGTKSFNGDSSKLCDFSNKYKSECFKEWLESVKSQLQLDMVDSLKKWGGGGQYLVLLRKQ